MKNRWLVSLIVLLSVVCIAIIEFSPKTLAQITGVTESELLSQNSIVNLSGGDSEIFIVNDKEVALQFWSNVIIKHRRWPVKPYATEKEKLFLLMISGTPGVTLHFTSEGVFFFDRSEYIVVSGHEYVIQFIKAMKNE